MKKIVTLLIPILFSMHFVSAQKSNPSSLSPQALHDFYIQKSKTKTMTAFALLVAGVVMANEGNKINAGRPLSQNSSLLEGKGSNTTNKKLWLLKLGKETTLASIPYFISSGDYRVRAVHFDRKEYKH